MLPFCCALALFYCSSFGKGNSLYCAVLRCKSADGLDACAKCNEKSGPFPSKEDPGTLDWAMSNRLAKLAQRYVPRSFLQGRDGETSRDVKNIFCVVMQN
jgi:hypothetical protein